ncbi:MAG: hypothetical protein VW779_00675 [Halieaceae bacterium]
MKTGYVLVKVDYDPEKYDLNGIASRMEGGQGCIRLSVRQVDEPSEVGSDAPFIGY